MVFSAGCLPTVFGQTSPAVGNRRAAHKQRRNKNPLFNWCKSTIGTPWSTKGKLFWNSPRFERNLVRVMLDTVVRKPRMSKMVTGVWLTLSSQFSSSTFLILSELEPVLRSELEPVLRKARMSKMVTGGCWLTGWWLRHGRRAAGRLRDPDYNYVDHQSCHNTLTGSFCRWVIWITKAWQFITHSLHYSIICAESV